MSDLKCAGMQLQGARRDLVTLEEATPRVPAVQFRYEGLGPDHEPIDRPAAIALAGALIKHVGDLMAELEGETGPLQS